MTSPDDAVVNPHEPSAAVQEPLRWAWVAGGVLLGAVVISLFVYLVDPALEQPSQAGSIFVLSVILVGILVGYRSHGETIVEAGIAGIVLLVLMAIIALAILGLRVPTFAWLISPFLVLLLAMAGGWVGEMLQGTLAEAHEDRAVDWPWLVASVIIGLTLSSYGVLLGRALLGLTIEQSLLAFAVGFLLTGWIVGFFSPGTTMVEPALAALMMLLIDAAFLILWFETVPAERTLLTGIGGSVVLALLGGWLGESMQRTRRARVEGAEP